MTSLFYIEHANGKVSDQSLKAITAASQIEGDVHGLIVGSNIDEAVAEASKINGLSKLLHLDDAAFDNVLAEPWGLVTLADVMLGGVCMGAVIFAHEKQKRVALMWTLPIFLLGHVVSVAWLLLRFLPRTAD